MSEQNNGVNPEPKKILKDNNKKNAIKADSKLESNDNDFKKKKQEELTKKYETEVDNINKKIGSYNSTMGSLYSQYNDIVDQMQNFGKNKDGSSLTIKSLLGEETLYHTLIDELKNNIFQIKKQQELEFEQSEAANAQFFAQEKGQSNNKQLEYLQNDLQQAKQKDQETGELSLISSDLLERYFLCLRSIAEEEKQKDEDELSPYQDENTGLQAKKDKLQFEIQQAQNKKKSKQDREKQDRSELKNSKNKINEDIDKKYTEMKKIDKEYSNLNDAYQSAYEQLSTSSSEEECDQIISAFNDYKNDKKNTSNSKKSEKQDNQNDKNKINNTKNNTNNDKKLKESMNDLKTMNNKAMNNKKAEQIRI